jgi:hypothetical protein
MRDWLQKHLFNSGILIWLGFNVVFNFAPYFLLIPGGILRNQIPSFSGYVTGGELLIIAVAVAADSMGYIILEKGNRSHKMKLGWLNFTLFVLGGLILMASTAFVDVKRNTTDLVPSQILLYSFIIFLGSFAISLAIRSHLESVR